MCCNPSRRSLIKSRSCKHYCRTASKHIIAVGDPMHLFACGEFYLEKRNIFTQIDCVSNISRLAMISNLHRIMIVLKKICVINVIVSSQTNIKFFLANNIDDHINAFINQLHCYEIKFNLLLLLSASPYSGSPQRDSNLHFTRSTSSPSLAPTLSMSSLTKSIHLLLGLPLFLLPGTAISIILFPT